MHVGLRFTGAIFSNYPRVPGKFHVGDYLVFCERIDPVPSVRISSAS